MKEKTKNTATNIILWLLVCGWFYWMNLPSPTPEPTYTMPKRYGEVKGYNYKSDHWDYLTKQKDPMYTQAQVDSIKRYARNMKADDFEELMEDYEDELESWGR